LENNKKAAHGARNWERTLEKSKNGEDGDGGALVKGGGPRCRRD